MGCCGCETWKAGLTTLAVFLMAGQSAWLLFGIGLNPAPMGWLGGGEDGPDDTATFGGCGVWSCFIGTRVVKDDDFGFPGRAGVYQGWDNTDAKVGWGMGENCSLQSNIKAMRAFVFLTSAFGIIMWLLHAFNMVFTFCRCILPFYWVGYTMTAVFAFICIFVSAGVYESAECNGYKIKNFRAGPKDMKYYMAFPLIFNATMVCAWSILVSVLAGGLDSYGVKEHQEKEVEEPQD